MRASHGQRSRRPAWPGAALALLCLAPAWNDGWNAAADEGSAATHAATSGATAGPGPVSTAGATAGPGPVPATGADAARAGMSPVPTVRVDRETFWFETELGCRLLQSRQLKCPQADTSRRVEAATLSVLRDHPEKFPQPPPLDVVVRAHRLEERSQTLQRLSDIYAYGTTDLIDGRVYIDVNLSTFVGDTPLNDAELRSFLAHELIHAYQATAGPVSRNGPELWRREIEAHEWELLHMEPGVRSWYRAEAIFNLDMYRRLLADE